MSKVPRIICILAGQVEQREAWPTEVEFFRNRLEVAGIAAEDGRVVLNPFSHLTDDQKAAVALNEAARVFMLREDIMPVYKITSEQTMAFSTYGSLETVQQTIAARLLSGDPSALAPTEEQIAFVRILAEAMEISWCPSSIR